jgi:ABC-type uncharacterized transport system involved in gliding motility auxiliary subunit
MADEMKDPMTAPQAPVEKSDTQKSLIKGGTLGAGVILAAALLLIVNYFGWKYYHRFDWTKSQFYTLSEKTENALKSVDRDIDAVVLMSPGEELYAPTRELLDRYQSASKFIHLRTIDPQKSPAEAAQLVSKYQLNSSSVVFDTGKDRRVIEAIDLADYDYSGGQMGQPQRKLAGFKGEQRFTGAILELVESKKPKILFTSGHGELSLDDAQGPRGLGKAQQLLGRDNVATEEWPTLGKTAVPDGTDLVVIAGPTSAFLKPELDVLGAYLNRGGRLLVLVDPTLAGDKLASTGLTEWLAGWGVKLGEDIVVDPSNPLPMYGADTIFSNSYGAHPITKSLRSAKVPVILSLARSVSKGTAPAGFEVTELLETTDKGWGETNLGELRKVEKDAADLQGPVSLGVAVAPVAAEAKPTPETDEEDLDAPKAPKPAPLAADSPLGKTRIVVFGDSDFASNLDIDNGSGDATLVADTMNWLIERPQLLGIGPKTPEQVHLSLTEGQQSLIFWLVILILPLLSVGTGVFVSMRRRR